MPNSDTGQNMQAFTGLGYRLLEGGCPALNYAPIRPPHLITMHPYTTQANHTKTTNNVVRSTRSEQNLHGLQIVDMFYITMSLEI